MKIGHAFGQASGWGWRDAYALAQRFAEEHGFGPGTGESWIVCTREKPDEPGHAALWTLVQKLGWFTGIWRSLENRVYVSDIDGVVLHGPVPDGQTWPERRVGFTLSGIWGLDDRHVYTWGLRGEDSAMSRWDGANWHEIPSPDFQVNSLHGQAPDLLVAVGALGALSRWDGSKWTPFDSGTRRNLSSVFVASEDEMYACGHGGALLQGSIHGWQVVLEGETQLPCVAKWRDSVYVGTFGELGLCKLEGSSLVSVRPKVQAMMLDTRKDLLASMTGAIVGTYDDLDYRGSLIGGFADATANSPPMW